MAGRASRPAFPAMSYLCAAEGWVLEASVILVDNSNVSIGGRKLSASRKGVERGEHGEPEAIDPSWRLDFKELLELLADARPVHAALLAGSRCGGSDAIWRAAEASGFEVYVHEREAHHWEKAVDTELAVRGTELIVSAPEPMTLILASGD